MSKDDVTFKSFSLRKLKITQDAEALFQALKGPEVICHMASSGISQEDCQSIIEDSPRHWQDKEFELLIVLGKNSWGLGKKVYSELIKLARERYQRTLIVSEMENQNTSREKLSD